MLKGGDLLKDWEEYVEVFERFLKATGLAKVYANPEIEGYFCVACRRARSMPWRIEDKLSMGEFLNEVFEGIRKTTNQAAVRKDSLS